MRNLRRIAVALAVPALAVGAITFTAQSALSAPDHAPRVAQTEQTTPQNTNTTTPGSPSATTASPTGSPTSASPSPTGTGGAGAAVRNCKGTQVQAPVTIKVATLGGKQALADADGCAVYMFNKDTPTMSACDSACAAMWHAVPGPGRAGSGVDQQKLGTFQRSNGSTQVTYAGHQLYYFNGDKAPGQTNGQNVNQSWFLLDPSGNPITQ